MRDTSANTKKAKRRRRLERDVVLDAAIQVARRLGTEALTIRDVASELGVSLMSLYYYVQNREDLINAIVARVGEQIVHPDQKDNDADEVEAVFLAFYDGVHNEAWGIHLLVRGHIRSANVLPLAQRALLALEGMGLNRAAAWHGYISLEHHLFGEILAINGYQWQTQESKKSFDESIAEFPVIHEFRREGETVSDNPRDHYRRALKRMIDALAAEGSKHSNPSV
ncbi:MAG: TetR/AcrR family transcriptional regulator [Pseudomonadota bacterium]